METNLTTQVFLYNENPVSFQMGNGDLMINTTQMAKSFGHEKRPQFWLKNQYSKEYLSELCKARNLALADLVTVRKGGTASGTWMHEDAAIEFARWLSPAFSIWCNDRIKELLKFGITATPEMLAKAVADPMFVIKLLTHIREEAEKRDILKEKVDVLIEQLEEQAPKVEFYDNIQEAIAKSEQKKSYTVSRIASELNMRSADLNEFLKRKGVQMKKKGVWILTSAYAGLGYAKTSFYSDGRDEHGDLIYQRYMVWTHSGKDFILSLFNE